MHQGDSRVRGPKEAPPAVEDPYWQGPYHTPSHLDEGVSARDEGLPRYGSVSARARQSYASEAMRSKSHVIAALLAFFLGIFGIHKFYLGCNQAGYVMMAFSIIGGLFTFGLATLLIQVIASVEGLIYLSESQTRFEYINVVNQRDWF